MTVFTSRFRAAYLKKRSKKTMILGTLLFAAAGAVSGYAVRQDEQDRVSMSSSFTSSQRKKIVASWHAPTLHGQVLDEKVAAVQSEVGK